jgi:N-acetylglucosamine-6-phosphate deacetylase
VNQVLTCEQFFDGDHMHGPHRLVLDKNGDVTELEPFFGEADFFCISPGLVDIQMNGFGDVDVASASHHDLLRLNAELRSFGTTSWLGTITTAPLVKLSATIDGLQTAYESGEISGLIGVHIEGPFLGSSPGAHQVKNIIPADSSWISTLTSVVKMMTVAPEQLGVREVIAQLRLQGICVALGHSQPTDTDFDAAISAGATLVTHLFNAMSGIHHRKEGLALKALVDDRVSVGLIADLVHVQPNAVELAFRSKGEHNVCMVSDSVGWNSPDVFRFGLVTTDAVRMANGTLAGSCVPLSGGIRNVVESCSVNLERALRSATSAPADVLFRDDIGRIKIGKPCDLVAFDASLTVVGTWVRLSSVGA